jgi:hypothetical protein
MARLVLAVLIVFAAVSCSSMKRDSSASTGSTSPSKSKSSGVSVARGAEDLPASGGASAPKMETKRKVVEVDCSKPVDLSQGQGNIRCK